MRFIANRRGQGLIEYLVLVALIAVGSLAVVRVVGANVSVQFAQIAKALGSKTSEDLSAKEITKTMVRKRDLNTFMQGAVGGSQRGKQGKDDGE
jgi:Flp pilus assembly pilin Flp